MKIYGFGSYFSGEKNYRDIDLLIVHDSGNYNSCIQAIECKKLILKEINNSSVSILSKIEELDFDFISRSHAVLLGEINEACLIDKDSIENITYMVKMIKKNCVIF